MPLNVALNPCGGPQLSVAVAVVMMLAINFTSGVTCASTTLSGGTWTTNVPLCPTSRTMRFFLSGLLLLVPTGGLPGGLQNVTWTGTFATSVAGYIHPMEMGRRGLYEVPRDGQL